MNRSAPSMDTALTATRLTVTPERPRSPALPTASVPTGYSAARTARTIPSTSNASSCLS